jgi:hypothetical protein
MLVEDRASVEAELDERDPSRLRIDIRVHPRLEWSPREGLEGAPKPPFNCEREIGFTDRNESCHWPYASTVLNGNL